MSARRRGSLILGIALCAVAVLIAVGPMALLLLGLLGRAWPALLALAGAGALAGYAVNRRPASPAPGAVLLAAGCLTLAFTIWSAANPFEFYGRWWPVLVGTFAVAELLRFYSHKPALGPRPPIFTFGKLAAVVFIAVTGIAADRVASLNPNVLATLDVPGFSEFRDTFFGQEFTFDPLTQTADVAPGAAVAISNRFGDIRFEGADGDRVEIRVTPRVRASSREAAEAIVRRLRLDVDAKASAVTASTNRDEIGHQLATDFVVRVPRGAAVRATNDHGDVVLEQLKPGDAGAKVATTFGAVNVDHVEGALTIENAHGSVEIASVTGDVSVEAPYSTVSMSDVTGDVLLDSVSEVEIDGLTAARLRLVSVDHGSVEVRNVRAPRTAAAGTLTSVEIAGEHTRVTLADIGGDVRVATTHASVEASNVEGTLDVAAQHTGVEVDGAAAVSIKTSFSDVELAGVRGPVSVENEHGGVDVELPVGPRYDISSTVSHGEKHVDGALARGADAAGAAIPVNLKTSYSDINVTSGDSDRADRDADDESDEEDGRDQS